jgi:flap endonuclease-1
MGVQITDLLVREEITVEALSNKKISVDAFNTLYQFLSTIRQRDGSLLTDSKGRVTSHLSGLFARTTNLMQKNIKLAFVFDGKTPELKKKERERREAIKVEAEVKHQLAVEREDIEEMKKYASRTSRLNSEMIAESKKLLEALGIPVIQAPSEGEAQAARMVKNGDVYALASQDADCLLFGTPILIRNLSVTGRRKRPGKLAYEAVSPEMIKLDVTLDSLKINRRQLIALGMLVGTDYNIGGIKGIGPKNALKLVKEYNNDFDKLFEHAKWDDFFDVKWKEVFDLIENMPVTDDYKLEWKEPDVEKVKKILCDEHDFSAERVESSLSKITEVKKQRQQKGLGDFI